MADFVKGIDVSKWQPGVDWVRLRQQEIRFAFIKATQGEAHVDPLFSTHWAGARQAGLLRGAYHFLDPDMDGRRQAENFLRTVRAEPGELPPALDIERQPTVPAAGGKKGAKGSSAKAGKGKKGSKGAATDQGNAQLIACAQAWLATVERELGCKPLLYTRANILSGWMTLGGKPPSWSSHYPVWVAQYFDLPLHENTRPDHAEGWQSFTFWQYSKVGELDGVFDNREMTVPTRVDLDFFKGTLEELYELAGLPKPAEGLEHIPQGEMQRVVPQPVDVPAVEAPSTYSIQAGDTLFGLARKFGTTVEALLAANPQISDPDLIRIGDTIRIPRA